MNFGKQFIWSPMHASEKLRYGNIVFAFCLNKPEFIISPHIKIPIPFMMKDHGVYCFIGWKKYTTKNKLGFF